MSVKLTRDSDKLICLLYKSYLEKKQQGQAKAKARYFGDSNEIQASFLPGWDPNDVAEECWSLERDKLLDCVPGDDLANEVRLSDNGIKYMENRFAENVKEVLSYITALKP